MPRAPLPSARSVTKAKAYARRPQSAQAPSFCVNPPSSGSWTSNVGPVIVSPASSAARTCPCLVATLLRSCFARSCVRRCRILMGRFQVWRLMIWLFWCWSFPLDTVCSWLIHSLTREFFVHELIYCCRNCSVLKNLVCGPQETNLGKFAQKKCVPVRVCRDLTNFTFQKPWLDFSLFQERWFTTSNDLSCNWSRVQEDLAFSNAFFNQLEPMEDSIWRPVFNWIQRITYVIDKASIHVLLPYVYYVQYKDTYSKNGVVH